MTHHLSDSFVKTVLWWKERLLDPLAFQQLHPVGPLQDCGNFINALTSWSIGIIIGNSWHAFHLVHDWKLPGHNEIVAQRWSYALLGQLWFLIPNLEDYDYLVYRDLC
jgi:hypothetical protein